MSNKTRQIQIVFSLCRVSHLGEDGVEVAGERN